MNKDQYKLNNISCINHKSVAMEIHSKFKIYESSTYYLSFIKRIDAYANILTQFLKIQPAVICTLINLYEQQVYKFNWCGRHIIGDLLVLMIHIIGDLLEISLLIY